MIVDHKGKIVFQSLTGYTKHIDRQASCPPEVGQDKLKLNGTFGVFFFNFTDPLLTYYDFQFCFLSIVCLCKCAIEQDKEEVLVLGETVVLSVVFKDEETISNIRRWHLYPFKIAKPIPALDCHCLCGLDRVFGFWFLDQLRTMS